MSHVTPQSTEPGAPAAPAAERPPRRAARRSTERRRFCRDTARAAEQASASAPRALFFVHVERLREVSEHCGEVAEEALSSIVERRLDEALGPTLARCHDSVDDFALLKDRCDCRQADAMAHRICAAIERETFVWGGATFRLGASVGVVEMEECPPRVDGLLERGAYACATARALGNDGVVVLDGHPGEREAIERERDWREHLNEVLV